MNILAQPSTSPRLTIHKPMGCASKLTASSSNALTFHAIQPRSMGGHSSLIGGRVRQIHLPLHMFHSLLPHHRPSPSHPYLTPTLTSSASSHPPNSSLNSLDHPRCSRRPLQQHALCAHSWTFVTLSFYCWWCTFSRSCFPFLFVTSSTRLLQFRQLSRR